MARGKRQRAAGAVKSYARGWWRRRLETMAQADLVNERIGEFERRLDRMEREGASRSQIERERERMFRHIKRMEDARDGYGEWPESEREAVARIAERLAG